MPFFPIEDAAAEKIAGMKTALELMADKNMALLGMLSGLSGSCLSINELHALWTKHQKAAACFVALAKDLEKCIPVKRPEQKPLFSTN